MEKQPQWEYSVLLLIPLGTIWGNVFVCLAVYLERRLRHRFNLFLVSLAFSDLLCAIFVMPMSTWKLINTGALDYDRILCLIWYSMDIFFTATTICHLCSISLDRYLALRRPLGHSNPIPKIFNSLIFRILMAWFVPFSIAGPLFLFALKQEELDKGYSRAVTNFQVEQSHNITFLQSQNPSVSYKGCGPNNASFVLTAIGVTFVLPLIIMTTTYILTVRTLREHMRQIKGMRLYETSNRRIDRAVTMPTTQREQSFCKNDTQLYVAHQASAGCDMERKNEEQTKFDDAVRKTHGETTVDNQHFDHTKDAENDGNIDKSRRLSLGNANLTYNNTQPANITQECSALGTREKSMYSTSIGSEYKRIDGHGHSNRLDRLHSGKRAVRVIGVLFGLFLACYLPFFIVYTIDVTCEYCHQWTQSTMVYLEWMGYLSSMLNPMVYHYFNSTFRNAFRKMMRCRYRKEPEYHANWRRRVRM